MGGHADMLRRYIADFNRGDSAGYAACYAPDVVLTNGGGRELHGRDAIVAFYSAFRERADRTMELRGVVEGEQALAAALRSRFVAKVDGVELGGATLCAGDAFELQSMALYELADGLFRSIRATTIESRVIRRGEMQ